MSDGLYNVVQHIALPMGDGLYNVVQQVTLPMGHGLYKSYTRSPFPFLMSCRMVHGLHTLKVILYRSNLISMYIYM